MPDLKSILLKTDAEPNLSKSSPMVRIENNYRLELL